MKARIDNRWTGGTVELICLPLAPHDIGIHGARFMEMEFQPGRGPELFLCILEQDEWGKQYGAIREPTLFATTLALNTELGPVGVVLWQLKKGPKTMAWYEHYIDTLDAPTQRMLQRIESQSRLKVVMRNNRSGETDAFWEFDNTFALGEFAAKLAQATTGMTVGPFDKRIQLVQREYPVEHLIAIVEQR